MNRKKLTFIICLLVCLLLTVMFTENVQAQSFDDLITTLENTDEMIIKRKWFTLNNSYAIYVDKDKVGTVDGKYINITGDVFKLKDTEGQVYGSEKQIKRWNIKLNRLAQVYDENSKTVGYIGEQMINDFFRLGKTFHFYDSNKDEVGVAKQKVFRLFSEFVIEDNNGTKLYKIKQQFSLFSSTYKITVYDNSVVPVEQSIYLTCILDAIKQAEESEE
ncbi:MAG TPA: hypothetical protein DCY20_11340 [Firmicutes bacterium]|nr:hypothetical protein [Bacillota bacterium]